MVKAALDSGGCIGASMMQEFQREFAQLCESRRCVGMAAEPTPYGSR